MTYNLSVTPSANSVEVEIDGIVEFHCSITEVYETGDGAYELVFYDGSEGVLNPEEEVLIILGSVVKFFLDTDDVAEIEEALEIVFYNK